MTPRERIEFVLLRLQTDRLTLDEAIEELSGITQVRIIPVSQWGQFHSWPSAKALYQMHYRRQHGDCLWKEGGRLLVDERAFLEAITVEAKGQRNARAKRELLPLRGGSHHA